MSSSLGGSCGAASGAESVKISTDGRCRAERGAWVRVLDGVEQLDKRSRRPPAAQILVESYLFPVYPLGNNTGRPRYLRLTNSVSHESWKHSIHRVFLDEQVFYYPVPEQDHQSLITSSSGSQQASDILQIVNPPGFHTPVTLH
jgi:hypothetical protein